MLNLSALKSTLWSDVTTFKLADQPGKMVDAVRSGIGFIGTGVSMGYESVRRKFTAGTFTLDPAFKEKAFSHLAQARAQAAQAGVVGFAAVALVFVAAYVVFKKFHPASVSSNVPKKQPASLAPVTFHDNMTIPNRVMQTLNYLLEEYSIKSVDQLPVHVGKLPVTAEDVAKMTDPVMRCIDQGLPYFLIKVNTENPTIRETVIILGGNNSIDPTTWYYLNILAPDLPKFASLLTYGIVYVENSIALADKDQMESIAKIKALISGKPVQDRDRKTFSLAKKIVAAKEANTVTGPLDPLPFLGETTIPRCIKEKWDAILRETLACSKEDIARYNSLDEVPEFTGKVFDNGQQVVTGMAFPVMKGVYNNKPYILIKTEIWGLVGAQDPVRAHVIIGQKLSSKDQVEWNQWNAGANGVPLLLDVQGLMARNVNEIIRTIITGKSCLDVSEVYMCKLG